MTNRGKLNLCIWKGENDKAAGHRVLFSLLSLLKENETASWRQVVLTSTRQTQQGRSVDLIIEVWRCRNIRNKKSWGLVGRIIRRTFPGRSRFVSVKLHKWRNWTLIGHKEGCFSKQKQLDNINKHSKCRNVWNVSNWHWTYWILIIKQPSVLNSQVGYNHGSSGKWLEKRHQSVLLRGVASGLFFFSVSAAVLTHWTPETCFSVSPVSTSTRAWFSAKTHLQTVRNTQQVTVRFLPRALFPFTFSLPLRLSRSFSGGKGKSRHQRYR